MAGVLVSVAAGLALAAVAQLALGGSGAAGDVRLSVAGTTAGAGTTAVAGTTAGRFPSTAAAGRARSRRAGTVTSLGAVAPAGTAGGGASGAAAQTTTGGATGSGGTAAWAGTPLTAGGGTRPSTAAMLAGLHLMNYQPSSHGWTGLWTDWQPTELDRDFAGIAALGGNAVRLSLIPDTLGWPTPTPTMRGRLAQVVDLAAAHGLRVQFTLFDWFDRTTAIDQSRAWAAAVTAPYRGDKRVVLAELLNEVNPDDPTTIAWLRGVLPSVRADLPGVPLTVSVSSTAGPPALGRLISQLSGLIDIADLHDYAPIDSARAWMTRAKAAAGGLPLFLGEAGMSLLYPDEPDRGVVHHEALQASWFDTMFRAARALGVPALAPWTYTDFTSGAIPGQPESQSPADYRFGLRRLDGTLRPAASVVAAWWQGRPPSGLSDDFGSRPDDGLPPGWSVGSPGAADFAWDQNVGDAAAGSARISASSSDAAQIPNLSRRVPVDVTGAAIAASAAVRLSGGGVVTIALGWYDPSGNYLGGVQSSPAPHTGGWSRLSVTGTPPAAATGVVVFLKASGVSGSAWFDDLVAGDA